MSGGSILIAPFTHRPTCTNTHMRYLQMLSNSIVVGFVAALYIALLVVLLNPSVPLTIGATVPVLAVVMLFYGVHIAVLTYAGFVLRQLIVLDLLWPSWVSLRILAWTSGAASIAIAMLLWLNVRGFRTALDAQLVPSLLQAAAVLAIGGGLLLALALTRTFVQRGPIVVGTLYAAIALGTVGIPLLLRGEIRHRHMAAEPVVSDVDTSSADDPRIVALLLDGASLDIIFPAVAAGRLPNFGRLLDDGASMHLATTRPTQPEPVWSSVVTGKWPAQHGIRGAAVYRPFAGGPAIHLLPDLLFMQALVRFGFLVEEPHTSASLRATPLWRILSGRGVTTGVIGLPLTHPVEPVRGFMVSDRFHRRLDPAFALDTRPGVYPAAMDELALAALEDEGLHPQARPAQMELLPQTGESGSDGSDVIADHVHRELAARLGAERDIRVLGVRYAGLDAVAHYYQRYATPDAFGDVSDEERQRFGRVLDDYYAYVDALIGDTLATLRARDLLVVVSGFGMEPLSVGKRLLERIVGNAQFSGTHERAPDGFLLAFGTSVARGRISRGAVVDITPTLLYFLNQPVARDMDGFARTDLFSESFNAQKTITFIPSYDRGG